jgi:hypothetical protein
MTWVAVGVGVGGAVAGTAGSMFGAASSNRAGRQARDWYHSRTNEGRSLFLNSLYGGNQLNNSGLFNDPNQTQLQNRGGLLGYNDKTLKGTLRQYDRANRGFNQDASRISGLAAGAEGMARGYGAGAEALIDQESARGLKAANAQAQARLNASGLGNSTFVGNQLANNQLNSTRMANQQKLAARQQTLDRSLGARDNRVNTERALAAARMGIGTGRASLFSEGRNRNAQFQAGALSSSVVNPWLGQGTSQFYPGVSGTGSGLATLGTSLAGLGGSGLFGGGGASGQPWDPYYGSIAGGANRPR